MGAYIAHPVKSRSTFAISTVAQLVSSLQLVQVTITVKKHAYYCISGIYGEYYIWQLTKTIGGEQPIAELSAYRINSARLYIVVHLFLHQRQWCTKLTAVFMACKYTKTFGLQLLVIICTEREIYRTT